MLFITIIAAKVLRAKAQAAFVPNGTNGCCGKNGSTLGFLRSVLQPCAFSWVAPNKALYRTFLIFASIAFLTFPICQGMTEKEMAEAAPGQIVSATLLSRAMADRISSWRRLVPISSPA